MSDPDPADAPDLAHENRRLHYQLAAMSAKAARLHAALARAADWFSATRTGHPAAPLPDIEHATRDHLHKSD